MELFSLAMLLFLALSLLAYYFAAPRIPFLKGRRFLLLLAASLLWYGICAGPCLVFPVLNAAILFFGGRRMEEIADEGKAKRKEAPDKETRKALREMTRSRRMRLLILCLLLLLLPLLFFKYLPKPASFSLLLPLGISFYTFTSISYLVDIYGEKIRAERSFPKLLLYVVWFPALLQGPIGRYSALSETLYAEKDFDRDHARQAVLLFLFGAAKKYAMADMLERHISIVLDEGVAEVPGFAILFSILLYSAWQYADFSGGIDMVLGISGLFGVELAPNFRRPYFAVSLGDFWRRWHISLGAFMRDYVFYPLALTKPLQRLGKKAAKISPHAGRVIPACIANIAVFAIVGIWHGPQAHFLVWGLYNGIVIALSDLLSPLFAAAGSRIPFSPGEKTAHVLRIIRTFVIVNIGWYFDRLEKVREAFLALFRTLFSFSFSSSLAFLKTQYLVAEGDAFSAAGSFLVAGICLVVVFANSLLEEKNARTGSGPLPVRDLSRNPVLFTAAAFCLLLLTLLSFVFSEGAGGFFYANF